MRSLFIASSCVFLLAIAGCGGGSSASAPPVSNEPPPPVTPPPPAPITGVATPSSVAVVTATNAQ
jgi:hypothetical protein